MKILSTHTLAVLSTQYVHVHPTFVKDRKKEKRQESPGLPFGSHKRSFLRQQPGLKLCAGAYLQ